MYNGCRNIKAFSEIDYRANKIQIYLDITGKRYYVMSCKNTALPDMLLRDGIAIENLVRWNGHNRLGKISLRFIHTGRPERFVKRLLDSVDFAMYDYGLVDKER